MNILNKLVSKVPLKLKKQVKLSLQLLFVALILGTLVSYFTQVMIYKMADGLTKAYVGGYEQISFK